VGIPRRRRAAFAAAAILFGLIVGLVIAELGFRVLGIRPQRLPPPRYLPLVDGQYRDLHNKWASGMEDGRPVFYIKRPSPWTRMGEYVPGARFRIVYASNPRGYFDDDNGIAVEINSLGMRGPEVTIAKPADTFRILGVGDSFTFGAGVREPDTYLRRLEGLLDHGQTPHVQVINAGTEGYNTHDEVTYLERRWLDLQPDLVVIGFYLNDAYSDATFLNMGQAQGVDLRQPGGLARWSYVWDYLQHWRKVRKIRRDTESYYRRHYFTDPAGEMSWKQCRAELAHAAELARQRGFRLAMVIFPEFHQLDGDYPFEPIHQLVASSARELGIPTLDLLDVFRGQRAEDLWVHPADHHPNQDAHRQAAEALAGFLRDQGLVP